MSYRLVTFDLVVCPKEDVDRWRSMEASMRSSQNDAASGSTQSALCKDQLMHELSLDFVQPISTELELNMCVVNQVKQRKLFRSGFTVLDQSKGSPRLPICQSSTSKVDITIFHNTKFVHDETVSGAALQQASGDEEQEEEEEEEEQLGEEEDDMHHYVLRGSAGELKLESEDKHKAQLILNMEKVAAELALNAVNKGKIFLKAIIYGFLIDKRGSTTVGKVDMDFVKKSSTLRWSNEQHDFNECLYRLHNVLVS